MNFKTKIDTQPQPTDFSNGDRIDHNRKRSYSTTHLRKKNIQLINSIESYLQESESVIDEEQLLNLKRRLWFSASPQLSLYREFTDGAVGFMGAIDSGHKLDAISNSRRSKGLRKKYWSYFKENSESGYTGKTIRKTGELLKRNIMAECDFMHLVLTCPHDENGYDGKRFYAKEMMAKFNLMRKQDFFKHAVYGGEYSCEIVRNADNGLHIHLHVLLVVEKEIQNRNHLYKELLMAWNKVTATQPHGEKNLTEEQTKFFKEKKLKNQYGNEYVVFDKTEVEEFNGSGATQLWLENLFVASDIKESKAYTWHEGLQKYTRRVKTPSERDKKANPDRYEKCLKDMLSGMMECLKYHFEPFALERDGKYDMPLIDEILPNIYRQPLYRKFGNFHGVKELNVNFKASPLEQASEIIEEYGGEVIHPETHQVADRSEYRYFTADPLYVYHDKTENLKPKIAQARRTYFGEYEPESLFSVLEIMIRHSLQPSVKLPEAVDV